MQVPTTESVKTVYGKGWMEMPGSMGHAAHAARLKNYNRIFLLNYIRRNPYTTKAELAEVSGLTFMAIKKIIDELTEFGLLRKDAYQNGNVGRRAVTYIIDENYGYTVGIHINVFETKAAVMDLHGTILSKAAFDMRDMPENQPDFVDMLVHIANEAIQGSGVDKRKLLGVGIGSPGPLSAKDGIVLTPPNLPVLRYLPLRRMIEERLRLPALLQKDTNAIAVGEFLRGAGAGNTDLMYIDADMGVGSGLILNGEIQQGANSIAGEFGHVVIDPNGPLCGCGNRGCLEALGSGISILKQLRTEIEKRPEHPLYAARENLTIQEVLAEAQGGDPTAISVLNQAAYYMGIAVSNLINILDPQIIVLGGILVLQYPEYFEIVKNTTRSMRIQGAQENKIVKSRLANDAGIVGAGEVVADHFFRNAVGDILSRPA